MKLYRSFATVGGMTMLSRLLGFVRDILIASVLGTGAVADTFFVAFRFPNLFRRLFAEGAFNSAFIPLFAKKVEGEGAVAARHFANEALSALVTALLVVTAIAEMTMPWLMYLIAPGFADDPEKFDLAVLLTRIAFPYLLFVSVVALYSGMMNALHRFAAAAFAPVMLNIVLISVMTGVAWAGYGNTPEAGEALAWGVAAGGVAQLLVLLFSSRKAGMKLTLQRPRMSDGVRRLLALGIPGVIAGGITQVNILIGTIIASMQDSAVSWLYYADRIYQLPLGLVGIAIGVVLLPDLSRKLRARNSDGALHSQNRSLELALLLTLPASAALMVAASPIIQVLFERGAFSGADTIATSAALTAFAAGLPAFVLVKVFSPGFFAREDTKTPMRYAGISVAVNIAFSLSLFWFIGHVGIAIATSLAGWVNAGLLAVTLIRRGHFSFDDAFRRRILPMCISCAVMGAALWGISEWLTPWFAPENGVVIQVAALAALVFSGIGLYAVIAHFTGALRLSELRRVLRAG
ncbi:MAG: murein biosynthesis integral membrane protein MurJ [Alphaproteobacteria bacterium]